MYQMVSGLHTSINSHISMQYNTDIPEEEELARDKNTLYKSQNATYFTERIGAHEDRVKNLYFVYAATLKALTILEPALLKQDYQSGLDEKIDKNTGNEMQELLSIINDEKCQDSFNEKALSA